MTSDRRGRRSLQFCKIIDALYILKGFATSGRRGADPYQFKIDASKNIYALSLRSLLQSPSVTAPSRREPFCFSALRFAAADICFAPRGVKFATQTLSHRPTKKLHQSGRGGACSSRSRVQII